MYESKYLEPFNKLKTLAANYKLIGNKLLVEQIELGEIKSKGGIIIAETAHARADVKIQKPIVAVVLMSGEGYYDSDTKETIPLDVQPGNVVMVADMGIKFYSVMPGITRYTQNTIGLTDDSNITMVWPNLKAFEEYVACLSES